MVADTRGDIRALHLQDPEATDLARFNRVRHPRHGARVPHSSNITHVCLFTIDWKVRSARANHHPKYPTTTP